MSQLLIFSKNGIIKSLIIFYAKSIEAGEENKLETENMAGDESERCCSGNGRNACCFSNKIFCFFALIFILSMGIMIGQHIGEKIGLPPDFYDNNVFINNQ